MNIILCTLIDAKGRVKYVPKKFKIDDTDVCVSDYNLGKINNNTIYYTLLEYDEERISNTAWSVAETLRRAKEINATTVKIFTKIENFYSKATEICFAYSKTDLSDYDEIIDLDRFKDVCKNMKKVFLGTMQDISFFRYTKIEEGKNE